MRFNKIAASVFALSLITSATISNEGVIKNIIPVNSISASAANKIYDDWEYIIESDNSATIKEYTGNDADIIVPSSIDGHTVKKVDGVFQNKTFINSVKYPSTVTEIADFTFNKCTGLTSVIMPGVTKIGWNAFAQTTSLTSINLPDTLQSIESNAFSQSGIKSITIKDGVALGNGVFKYCVNLKTFSIPSTWTEIGPGMFSGSGLTSITIPSNIKVIGSSAFSYCSNLSSVSIPSTVTSIGSSAFASDAKLKSITLSANLTEIGDSAFEKTGISAITVPSKVTKIGNYAFSNCPNLNKVEIKGTCTMGQSVWGSSDKVTDIKMNTATWENSLYGFALRECRNLSKINGKELVQFKSNGEPFIPSELMPALKKYFERVDNKNTPFFDKYIDETVKYVARTETAGCSTDLQKVTKLHDWVCNKMNYAYDSNGEPDPSEQCHVDSSVFMRDTTVCDGYARAYTLLLQSAGIEAYYLSGVNHAWTMVKVGDRYFHVDTCHDGQGDTTKYSHFLKSDNGIRKCSFGHGNWGITIPSGSRIRYTTKPSTKPVCSYSLGDVNKDGTVNQADVDYLCRYLAKFYDKLPERALADVTGDGYIDISDAVATYRLFD